MNCAPITVTAGSKKRDLNATEYNLPADSVFGKRDATFPEMFVANLGDGCKTVDNVDLEFPNPGSVLQKAGTAAPVPPQGTVSHFPPSIFFSRFKRFRSLQRWSSDHSLEGYAFSLHPLVPRSNADLISYSAQGKEASA